MKSLTAILLIGVFAFSQYAKQLAYMECKLANSISLSAQQCDCEKKYSIHTPDDKKPLTLQANFHPVIDEFYCTGPNELNERGFNFLTGKTISLPFAGIDNGNCSTPYRPPQA